MKILVDADACPVLNITEQIAKEKKISLLFLCDTSHHLESEYAEVITISKGNDAVDFALINRVEAGDIVITQDYGVAVMALGKKAYPIHQSGKWYTNENIDQMLLERHVMKTAWRTSRKKLRAKGQTKRKKEDDLRFEISLKNLIEKVL